MGISYMLPYDQEGITMELKDKLLELRKQLSLSQGEFVDKLFVTRQVLSRWENGV